MTISNNAKRFAADLPTAAGDFFPDPNVHLSRAVGELASEDNYLSDNKFGDRAGVGEWRVEDSGASAGGVHEVDLGSADAEAADCEEVFGMFEDVGSQFCFGADTNDMDIPVDQSVFRGLSPYRSSSGKPNKLDLLYQLFLGQGTLVKLDLVPLALEDFTSRIIDILKQQYLDVLRCKRLQLFFGDRLVGEVIVARCERGGRARVEGVENCGWRSREGYWRTAGDGRLDVTGAGGRDSHGGVN